MCTLNNNPRLRKPKTETFIAYKVFDRGSPDRPSNYAATAFFDFGIVIWDQTRANESDFGDQLGFQMFAYKKDALEYAAEADFVCKVEVRTKDIKKIGTAGKNSMVPAKAYEAARFKLLKKNWKKKTKKG